ncbi:ABC-three component system middle component 1 [Flavobacterium sp. XS1P32]|uniref:ABC-three component system middle component 1 n=1 Tax=Flavobacterium sp. XS1P32 TaxID=3401726 RepID=UPI003AADAE2F
MEKYLEYSADVINQLKEKYKTCDFQFQLAHANVNISVFFVLAKSSILSEESLWENISKEIALKYQSKLETVYEKWNLYIIYITSDITPKELKNKVENDKFSSRKIVEDSYSKEFDNDEANRLIVKHITNSDLKEIVDKTQEVTISEFVPKNKNIWELLEKEEKVIGDREAQGKLIKEITKL